MANYFDQFDAAPAAPVAQGGANYFDQFDPPKVQPSIMNQISSNIAATKKEAEASGARLANGQQSLPENIAQGLSQGFGIIGDVASPVIGAGLKSAYNALTTQGFKDRQNLGLETLANSDAGQAISKGMQNAQQGWSNYEQKDPAGAADLKALGTALTMGGGKIAPDITNAAIDYTGNAIKNVATDSALYAPRGVATVTKGILAKSPEQRQVIEDALKASSTNDYDALDAANIITNSNGSKKISDTINQYLKDNKVSLNPTTHPNTYNVIKGLDDIINSDVADIKPTPDGNVNTLSGLQNVGKKGELSISALDQQRKALGGASFSNPEDVRAASIVRDAMDTAINPKTSKIMPRDLNNGTPENMGLLQQAQAKWAQKSKYEDINDILTKADGDPNKIKSGLTNFLNKDKNTKGWSEQEYNALRNAAQSGVAEKLYKMGGKFGLDLGTSLTPGNTVAPIIGGALTGGPISGAAVIAGGTALRQLQKYMARGKAEQLLSVIQKGGLPKEIMALPAPEASQIIQQIRSDKN